MGRVATQPLPSSGSPLFQSGGQNQGWLTSGPLGYITPTAWGVRTASQQWAKSQVALKCASWLHKPCRLGDPHRFIAGGTIARGSQVGHVHTEPPLPWGVPTASQRGAESHVGHKLARWLHNPYPVAGPHRFRPRDINKGRSQVGQVATQILPCGGSPLFQSGGQNQGWLTSGPLGYITPTAWGVRTASQQGTKSQVALKCAGWLHKPCRLGDPHRFIAGGTITSGSQLGHVDTEPPLPWGVPTASQREAQAKMAHKWARWLQNPCPLGGPHRFTAGVKIRWRTSGIGGYITHRA